MKRILASLLLISIVSGCSTPRWVKRAYVTAYDAITGENDVQQRQADLPCEPADGP
jgi:hypothetical protein